MALSRTHTSEHKMATFKASDLRTAYVKRYARKVDSLNS